MPPVSHWFLLFLYLFKFDTALALSSPPTGNPSGCENGTEFLQQSTWHYAPNNTITRNSTFLQQYQIVTTHFRPGGPIFFLQGPESSIQCADWFQFASWAPEFGAMLVAIEHRYFGLSMPFNLTWDNNAHWTKTDLEALTLENVVMDSVGLIDFVKKTIPGARNSPVIAYGGSYGGTLVTLLRTRLPEIFFGSIASSPPTRFVTDVQSNHARLWGDWVSQVCLQHSVTASERIKAGFQAVRERFNPSNFAALKHELGLCTTPNATSQLPYVLYVLAYSYGNIAQFGYKFPPLYNKALSGFEYLIQETLDIPNDADPIKFLRPAADLQAMYTASTCLDWEPDHLVQQTLGSPFIWLWCTYMPYAKFQSSADSIFGRIDTSEGQPRINDPMCQRRFGINSIDAGLQYDKRIGVDPDTLRETERLSMWYGGNDAVTSIGAVENLWLPNGDPKRTQVIFATGAGHTQDMLASLPNDTDSLVSTRHFERQAIKLWLNIE